MSWPVAFMLTVLIEAPVGAWLLRAGSRAVDRSVPGWPAALALLVLAQVVTHPALWFLAPRFAPYHLWVLTAEAAVVLVEVGVFAVGLITMGPRAGRSPRGLARATAVGLLASLVANTVSTLVGLWLQG